MTRVLPTWLAPPSKEERPDGDCSLVDPTLSPPPAVVQFSPTHLKHQSSRIIMAKPDPYADIDFEEINDATGLAIDEIKCLKVGGSLMISLQHHCCGDLDCNKR